MKRKLSLLLALVLVLSVFLAACGKTEEPADVGSDEPTETEAPEEGAKNPAKDREGADNTIIIGMTEAKGELMPVYYSTGYDGYVVDYMFDQLFTNDEAGEYIPHVAKEWEISDDKLTYTFHLRDDVKFADGTPLTAHDVEFTYLAMADPNYDGRYFAYVDGLVGYEEYAEGNAENLSGVVVHDDYTISFTFKEPRVANFTYCNMHIMPKHHYDFEKGDIEALKAKMRDPLGSGGYSFVHLEPGQYIELKANMDYFLGAPKIENLILKFTTAETYMAELEKGTIDVQNSVTNTVENKETMEAMGFVHLNAFPNNGYAYIGLNHSDPRLADKNVRQALVYGLDRQSFVTNFFKGHGQVCHVPLSPVSWAYTDTLAEKMNKYEYNPDKAVELLEEAGWKLGSDGIREKDGMKLKFVYSTYPDSEWVEQLIPVLIDNWGKIGVAIEINYMDFNALSDAVYEEHDFDMYNMAWSLTVDPDSYSVYHSSQTRKAGNNAVQFINEKNDQLLEAGRKEFDQEKRKEIYEEWALNINEELPYIYIYQREEWNMVNDRIKGFECSPFVDMSYPQVYLNMEIVK
ncbi:Oligopeptide ABC transporter, periplasmic oligopeptide-binding protein OppA (TC 3.A.1.5.1) [[Clostridium] ultunense Esp]|uniref:ABC transporter substrate-binding protein n=1 Tax=Schnuerera ultunensis TaxID=45497 RepID=UPI0002B6F693|nr:ABC transporter substrate-binding protein [Schnuerera ultunensis]CCQ94066.1 Oligopeptide ABC transporter, periplasmic oligopeptide-binding protein OppA (TC 3.A.1.5.1) [[Clostridium] ultunense Esp]